MINSGRSAIRSMVVMLALFALAVTGAVTVTSTSAMAAGGVEDSGAGCPVTLPGSLTANSMLPDPFTRLNGTRISSVSDWTCRREEILQLAQKYIYGTKPAKPASVTGTVSSTNITVNVSNNGKSASWSAGVQLPSTGSGPFPAVIVYGGSGVDTSTILNSGAAVINYNPYNVGAEGTARDQDTGAFYTLYGPSDGTGLLMAWAWGVSRIIDVIEQSGGNILKADDTGVSGCSRFGKGAFVAGVFDQRIPLTMPVESGTDGVPIYRGIPGESGSQPLSNAYGEQPWVGDAFSQFNGNPNMLPVDTHEMVGMVAPRGLFIMENPHIDWLGARSGSVAALGGAEVYKALGAGSNISYVSDVADGTHCATRSEWQAPMAASIRFFLENAGTPPAVFRISSLKQGTLSQWRNWTTPTLSSSSNTVTVTSPGAQAGTVGTAASLQVSATDSAAGQTLTYSATGLPAGLTISSAGLISGTPTAAGASNVTVTATDGTSASGATSFTWTVSGGTTTGTCHVTYTRNSEWPGNFTAQVVIANTGTTAINGWSVTFTFPGDQKVTANFNGGLSMSGENATLTNASYNATIAAGASTTDGFQGTFTSNDASPTSFAVNGSPCS
jgi:glucuronyl esterase-like protein/cellulose binding protein with CBM2 domain/putative Ig domain-containing protein